MNANAKLSKREQTRRHVIAAAIDCIYEQGFNAAHTNRIAEAAGVSWGVLQYHFGDKDGLLQAVLDDIFEDFSSTLGSTELKGETLEARVAHLIEVVWSLVSKKEYRVSVAILRNAGKDDASSLNGEKQVANWARTTSGLWDRLFEADPPDPERSEIARHLLFAALRGMADEINPSSRSAKAKSKEREALAMSITYLLSPQP